LIEIGFAAQSRVEALTKISIEISQDPALRRLVQSDPLDIAKLVSISNHPTWVLVHQGIAKIFGADAAAGGIILRWLIGQVASPITEAESHAQAKRLAKSLFE
jgi:hypothetical protein